MKKKRVIGCCSVFFIYFLVSCLQSGGGAGLPEYIPSTEIITVQTPVFSAEPGSDTLIVKIAGGEFKPREELSTVMFVFTVGGNPRTLGTPARDSETQITFPVSVPSGAADCQVTILADALRRPAGRAAALAVKSGVWKPVDVSTFGNGKIWSIGYGGGKTVAVGAEGRMAYSSDGVTWTAIQPGTNSAQSQFTNTIRDIAYGNGRFVAVGYDGKAAYSYNGIDWTTAVQQDNFTGGILCVAYGNGRFVAGGDNGRIAWSTDGAIWNSGGDSKFGSNRVAGMTYGSSAGSVNTGVFVAVGAGGQLSYSTDGREWTFAEAAFGHDPDESSVINSAAYGNGVFVAVNNSGKLAYSNSGGVTWSLVSNSVFGSTGILDVAFGSGIFLAVGHNGKMASSLDGKNWTADLLPELSGDKDGEMQTVCYAGDKFILGGNVYATGAGIMVYGYGTPAMGGLNPEDITASFNCTAGSNALIVTLIGGVFAPSPTPAQFRLDNAALPASYTLIRDSDSQVTIDISGAPPPAGSHTLTVLAAAQSSHSSRVAISADARIKWNQSTVTGDATGFHYNRQMSGLAWSGNAYVAVGEWGTVSKSTNGVTWTTKNEETGAGAFSGWGSAPWLNGAAWGGNQFVAVGQWGTVIASGNGDNWTVTNTGTDSGAFSTWGTAPLLNGAAWGGGKFAAVGEWGTVITSGNGDNWTVKNTGTGSGAFEGWGSAPALNAVAWGGGRFVAVGENGNIITSGDGDTWAVTNTGVAGGAFSGWGSAPALNAVAWGGGTFVAVGQWGAAAYSTNGETWTTTAAGLDFGSTGMYAVAYNSALSVFVIAGDNGKMAKSADGIRWTMIPEGTADGQTRFEREECIRALCYGGRFVAAGNRYEGISNPKQGKIAYSD